MILSQKQIEEIAAAVTEDFNKFFFGTESEEVRMARATPIDQLARDYTHEPIIDMQTWETVQKLRQGKRRPTSIGETSKYSGLLFCADCGSKLYFNHKRADDPKSYSFNCSHYRNNAKEKCMPHRIREVVLDEILLEELRRITYTARTKERQFAEFINQKSSTENRREFKAKQREYERLSKRTAELNALFKRLYEDNVLGRINNEQFRMLSCGYMDEQKSINALTAADEVIIPIDPELFALTGLQALVDTIQKIKRKLNPSIEIGGILFTKCNKRTNLYRRTYGQVTKAFQSLPIFNCQIPYTVKVGDANSYGMSVMELEQANPASLAYLELAKEVLANA